jgi:hypothetical protein
MFQMVAPQFPLVCSRDDNAAYILRGLFREALFGDSHLKATGPEAPALVDFIMSKDCPVSASLTNGDKTRLLNIKQRLIKSPEG